MTHEDIFSCTKISSSVAKRFPLESRINDVLTPFDFEYPKHFDDNDGISQDELDVIKERAGIKAMELEFKRADLEYQRKGAYGEKSRIPLTNNRESKRRKTKIRKMASNTI